MTDHLPTSPVSTDTRRRVQQVALALFTRQGYASTSLREIATEVGITKASLYYHFPSKAAIVASLFEDRGEEARTLVEWVRTQPPADDLLERAVLHWVDASAADKLRGIRFLAANPLLARDAPGAGDRIGDALASFVDEVARIVPLDSPEDGVLLRMALLSINAEVEASARTGVDDGVAVGAARRAALALVAAIRRDTTPAEGERR